MTRHGETIREFETANYRVRVEALEEFDLDLSFDEDGSVREGLNDGSLIAFCAHATVTHKPTGMILGEDYLGNCIYKSLDDFANHRACGRQNREYEAKGDSGRCGSYFTDMIHEAIDEARKNAAEFKRPQLRTV